MSLLNELYFVRLSLLFVSSPYHKNYIMNHSTHDEYIVGSFLKEILKEIFYKVMI